MLPTVMVGLIFLTNPSLVGTTNSIPTILIEDLPNLSEPIVYLKYENSTIAALINGSHLPGLPDAVIQEIKNGLPAIIYGNNSEKIYDFVKGNGPIQLANQTFYCSGIKIYPQEQEPALFEVAFAESLGDIIDWTKKVWNQTVLSETNVTETIAAQSEEPSFYLWRRNYWYREWPDKGKLNLVYNWYKIKNEANPNFDYFALKIFMEVVPGRIAYGSGWCTSDVYNGVDADYFGGNQYLVTHGPTTTEGVATVSYTLGITVTTEGGGTAVVSMQESYSISDVVVHDWSDASEQRAAWWHDVQERTVGMDTYVMIPGAGFEIPQEESWSMWFWHKVKFGRDIFFGIVWEYWESPQFDITMTYTQHVTLDVLPSTGGSIFFYPPGSYEIKKHSKRVFYAMENSGYRFAYWKIYRQVNGKWEEYCVGAVNPLHITMSYSYRIQPIFWKWNKKGGGGGGGGC